MGGAWTVIIGRNVYSWRIRSVAGVECGVHNLSAVVGGLIVVLVAYLVVRKRVLHANVFHCDRPLLG
jgi:hypothetical protein